MSYLFIHKGKEGVLFLLFFRAKMVACHIISLFVMNLCGSLTV